MISLGKVLKNITVLGLLGLTMTSTNAFVLLGSSAPPRYPSGDIQIKLVGNQACSTITESTEELIEIAREAADDFWNTVHTSSINLMVTGKVSAGGKDIADFISAANNNIVIGCSTDSIIYSTSTIAVGGYSYTSGNLKGYVALNDHSGSPFPSLSRRDKVATLAHEIGHALGIGHSEKDFALMFYASGAVYNYLSQDDADAITYLYPHDSTFNGLGGNCGSISKLPEPYDGNKKNSQTKKTLIIRFFAFIIGFSIISSRRLIKRLYHNILKVRCNLVYKLLVSKWPSAQEVERKA
tara:strand:- start:89 stop:976 length:888 start_codon:yes stop_codon:yes gene_type:complete